MLVFKSLLNSITRLTAAFSHSFRIHINKTRNYSNSAIHFPTEIQIEVPWGIIAGRHWNADSSKTPVICLHGWKDNSASFNKILPLLIPSLNQYQFLCIDFPGHGLSSHYPLGLHYNIADTFGWIVRVMKNFGWTQITIIGHSLGAIIGFLFTSTHSSSVKNLIAIDGLTPVIFSNADMLRMVPVITNNLLEMEEKIIKGTPPKYTYDQAFQTMQKSHMMGMNDIACKTLLTRSLKENPIGSNSYTFSHDMRVQYLPVTTFSHRQISYLAKNFKSGLLHIKALEGVNYMSTYMNANIQHWIESSNDQPVRFVKIENATHHVHLTDPNSIVKYIVEFL